jgi:hypothetical protein
MGLDATASLVTTVGGRGLGGAGGGDSSDAGGMQTSFTVLDFDFLRRLMHFFRPSSEGQFSAIESSKGVVCFVLISTSAFSLVLILSWQHEKISSVFFTRHP